MQGGLDSMFNTECMYVHTVAFSILRLRACRDQMNNYCRTCLTHIRCDQSMYQLVIPDFDYRKCTAILIVKSTIWYGKLYAQFRTSFEFRLPFFNNNKHLKQQPHDSKISGAKKKTQNGIMPVCVYINFYTSRRAKTSVFKWHRKQQKLNGKMVKCGERQKWG